MNPKDSPESTKKIITLRIEEWKLFLLRKICEEAGIKMSTLIRVVLDLVIFDPKNQIAQLVITTCLHPEMRKTINKAQRDYFKKLSQGK